MTQEEIGRMVTLATQISQEQGRPYQEVYNEMMSQYVLGQAIVAQTQAQVGGSQLSFFGISWPWWLAGLGILYYRKKIF